MAFKICIIGCGGISESCHGPSYVRYRLKNPDTVLAACCDIVPQKAAAYRQKFGFGRCYEDFTEMLRAEKPDAVCVTVDEDHAASVGVEVLNMGFPMFIEKPPGKDSVETQSLIRAARKSGVINQVGYNRRAMPILRKLKSMLTEAAKAEATPALTPEAPMPLDVPPPAHIALAQPPQPLDAPLPDAYFAPQFIRYDFYRVRRFDDDFSDTAVHGIDAVRYIAGADYKTVHFSYQALPQFGANVKNIYMDCVMTSGLHAQLSFCPVSGVVLERATVHAKDNTWMAHTPIWAEGYDRPGELIHIRNGETAARISGAELCDGGEVYITNGFYNEDKEFFDNVKAGRPCACDLASALNTSLIKDCITDGTETYG